MPLPKLSPLQSRLAASLLASGVLILLYLSFRSSGLAYAAELASVPLAERHDGHPPPGERESRAAEYMADFLGADRSLVGRVVLEDNVEELKNNRVVKTTLALGETIHFAFSNTSLARRHLNDEGQLSWAEVRKRHADSEGVLYVHDRRGVIDGEDGKGQGAMATGDEGNNLGDEDEDGGQKLDGQQLARRQDQRGQGSSSLYITVNVCQQPTGDETNGGIPPQLRLWLSQSASNTKPGPGKSQDSQTMLQLTGGAGLLAINATGDVYIGLSSDNATDFSDDYEFEIAASTDAPYHTFNTRNTNLVLVDSDASSALLVTQNLTSSAPGTPEFDRWMAMDPPYTMFASKTNDSAIMGVSNSYCGLQKYAEVGAVASERSSATYETGMTTRGNRQSPRQQFYMTGLTRATSYWGFLAMDGNASSSQLAKRDGIGGGGQVFRAMRFSTLKGMYLAWIMRCLLTHYRWQLRSSV